jgi:small subunit ribosomal protein S21
MPSVQAKKNEPFERLFKRWKRLVENDGLLNVLRQREFYEKPSQKRKRAKAAAKKRWERKQSEMNVAGSRKRLY